jgi:hypothetical protein
VSTALDRAGPMDWDDWEGERCPLAEPGRDV